MATEAVPRTVPRPLPGPRVTAPTPDIRPRAGHELLVGVEKVLDRLRDTDSAPNAQSLADDLRTALARTAALGDSCRVRPQCDGVRLAADLLLADEVVDAHAILIRMQSELADRQRR
ncbi:hypothetical protein [Actinophytocola sp.]|uniref:hypothetical protein n=1 Tax=Actinophytocola sp. TaxID=1872138 RepID=UPI002ECFE9B6